MGYKCKICGSSKSAKLLKVKVAICNSCGFGSRISIPSQEELSKIYMRGYFADKDNPEYERDAKQKFRKLKKHFFNRAKILDFGCGMGQFAKLCKARKLSVYGYDISRFASSKLRKKYRIPATSGPLSRSIYPKGFFDFIVLFDVIEHIKDSKKILSLFHYWLKDGGKLIMTTPNIRSWDARLLGEKWDSFQKNPEHIYFFSPKAISLMVEIAGFKNVKVGGWGFMRSINFVMEKKIWGDSRLIKFTRRLLKSTGIGNIFIFFRMHNMIITAGK